MFRATGGIDVTGTCIYDNDVGTNMREEVNPGLGRDMIASLLASDKSLWCLYGCFKRCISEGGSLA